MFGSRGKKALVGSADRLVETFRSSANNSGSQTADKDAALLACGFLHYALAFMLQTGRIKPNEMASVFSAFAMAIRRHAPDHGLPVSYLEDTRIIVMNAITEAGGDPVRWLKLYYEALAEQVTVDEGVFLGALARETMALRGG